MDAIERRSLEQLQELIGGDQESLFELIKTFLGEGEDIVADMRKSLPAQDLDLLRRSAHSLKSSSQDFGAAKLSESCGFLEYSCKSTWPDRAEEQVTTIAAQFEIASESLQAYLTE